jgi:hypothetical protein
MDIGAAVFHETGNSLPVLIIGHPQPAVACADGAADFSTTAFGTEPFTYRWEIEASPMNWVPLSPAPTLLPCGGSATSSDLDAATTITILPCPGVNTYQIRASITNVCGTVLSDPATLTICRADYNCDGGVSSQDFFDFLAAFFGGNADFNVDGATNSQDFFDFLAAFFSGDADFNDDLETNSQDFFDFLACFFSPPPECV